MTVSYNLKASDHWALNRYVLTHDWRTGGSMAIAALIIPAFLFQSTLRDGKPWQEAAGNAAMVLVIAVALGYPLFRYLAWTKYAAMPKHLYSVSMTLNDTGVQVKTSEVDQTIRWNAFTKVRRDRTAVYLFLSRRTALIVPIRSFAKWPDVEAFCGYAAGHIHK